MGTKFKEVNTLSFIGNIGPKTERVGRKSTKKSTSSAAKTKIAPLNLLEKDLPCDGDTLAPKYRRDGDDPNHTLHEKPCASGRRIC